MGNHRGQTLAAYLIDKPEVDRRLGYAADRSFHRVRSSRCRTYRAYAPKGLRGSSAGVDYRRGKARAKGRKILAPRACHLPRRHGLRRLRIPLRMEDHIIYWEQIDYIEERCIRLKVCWEEARIFRSND